METTNLRRCLALHGRALLVALMMSAGPLLYSTAGHAETPPTAERQARPMGSSLHLVFEVTPKGDARAISVVQIAGRYPRAAELAGPYVYEVRTGGSTSTVGSFADPFEQRSAAEGVRGHHVRQLDRGTVVIKIPDADLKRSDLGISLYRLSAEAEMKNATLVELKRALQAGHLELLAEIPADELTRAFQELGQRLDR